MVGEILKLQQFNKLYKFLKGKLKTSSSTAEQEQGFFEAFKQERPLILKELFGTEYDQSTILQQAEGLDFNTIPDQTQRGGM